MLHVPALSIDDEQLEPDEHGECGIEDLVGGRDTRDGQGPDRDTFNRAWAKVLHFSRCFTRTININQTRWDHGDFKVQLQAPTTPRAIGFSDGTEDDATEPQPITELEGADTCLISKSGGKMIMKRLRLVSMPPATRVLAIVCLAAATSATARADVFSNVPEALAENYQLVYTLSIEDQASYNITGSVPYTVDNSASITSPFDRIAYYLELDTGGGLEYAYASMDAFTSNASQIGLPIDAIGTSFQRLVSNLNVVSNSSGVTTGTGMATGNIEFWPRNYATNNALGIPGASSSTYDFGDERAGDGNYGSFQVHNHGAGETIFAYNQWGGVVPGTDDDVGIGNAPTGHPDWTFASNASTYSIKNLQVLVRPSSLSIDARLERADFQRDPQNEAGVLLTGAVVDGITSVEARAMPRAGGGGTATAWQVIDGSPGGGSYAGTLTLDGGWYDIDVRALLGATVVEQRTVERVGVGDVFVTAGQSNSANHGSDLLTATDDRVSAFDLNAWRHADDPQPIATGSGGSPWPALGDGLVAEHGVPVGLISVGWGGTSVEQWLPGGSLYPRLKDALQALGPNGARAVLWHQGETDNVLNTSTADYRARLEAVIAQSRFDAGFDIPWGIALASFVPPSDTDQNIIDAQQQVAENDLLNFVGASTDDLIGPAWRAPDGIHFNEAGLREHAARWRVEVPTTDVADQGNPSRIQLAFPNPFVSGGPLSVTLPKSALVELSIYGVAGRHVTTLHRGVLPAGAHDFTWDIRGDDGSLVMTGVYFIRVDAGMSSLGRKLIVVR
jgi:hypothetical protein